MRMRWIGVVCLCALAPLSAPPVAVASWFAEAANTGKAETKAVVPGLKPGVKAPAPHFTDLWQSDPAPVQGQKLDWSALRGKAIVLEFWATWCAPCVAEIPQWNALVKSVDPSKVAFVSVDDEDPALVKAFLKKKPIAGWIGIDSSGKVMEQYGVYARPATVVIGPDGRVASTAPLPAWNRERLLRVAAGHAVTEKDGGPLKADTKKSAETAEATKEAFAAQGIRMAAGAPGEFSVTVTPAEAAADGATPDTHVMLGGPGRVDVTNAPVDEVLSQGLGIPKERISVAKELPGRLYNLHLSAQGADQERITAAMDAAVEQAAHVRVRHSSEMSEVYLLTALPGAASHMDKGTTGGVAAYSHKMQVLQCIHATTDQVAQALEHAMDLPVVNESGLDGTLMVVLKMAPKDLDSANAALATVGLTLTKAQRQVERIVVTAAQ